MGQWDNNLCPYGLFGHKDVTEGGPSTQNHPLSVKMESHSERVTPAPMDLSCPCIT